MPRASPSTPQKASSPPASDTENLAKETRSFTTNHRTDQWGGDFTGRTRVVLDTVDAVRAALPSQAPLLLRISATDPVRASRRRMPCD